MGEAGVGEAVEVGEAVGEEEDESKREKQPPL